MALMSIREFIELNFTDGSRPRVKTIIDWIERGELKKRRIGRKYYVDDSELKNDSETFTREENKTIKTMIDAAHARQ